MKQKRQKYLDLEIKVISIIQDDVVRTSMAVADPYSDTEWEDSNKGFNQN